MTEVAPTATTTNEDSSAQTIIIKWLSNWRRTNKNCLQHSDTLTFLPINGIWLRRAKKTCRSKNRTHCLKSSLALGQFASRDVLWSIILLVSPTVTTEQQQWVWVNEELNYFVIINKFCHCFPILKNKFVFSCFWLHELTAGHCSTDLLV